MNGPTYRFEFDDSLDLDEVEGTLLMGIMGTESLHGTAQVRLDTRHYLDREQRTCVVDASCNVGRDLARLFCGFLIREFGEDAFSVTVADSQLSSELL